MASPHPPELLPTLSIKSDNSDWLGSTEPRIWTPPLRELTPETSYGFDVIDFAKALGTPLDPWEEWTVIHGGELLPDGRPRFRTLLILVARQNGKTLLLKIITLYWLFIEYQPLILGLSTLTAYAKEAWHSVINMAKANEWLAAELAPNAVRETIAEECFTVQLPTDHPDYKTRPIDDRAARYKIAAANRRAGRSLTVHRLLVDELREHDDFTAWDAAYNATNAVMGAQTIAISNQGDDTAVVLDALRNAAIDYIETGNGDSRLGLIEYSAPAGSDPTDIQALAMANPNLGRRLDTDALLGAGLRAKRAGGKELAGYLTEVMCMRVPKINPAIDPTGWTDCGSDTPLDLALAEHRRYVAMCFDVALDGSHATLAAAALIDGIVWVEIIEAWDGFGCTKLLRAELPTLITDNRPRALGWFPAGPSAAVAADMAKKRGWPPRRVTVEEIRSEVTAVCMGLPELVLARELRHPKDPMLNNHVDATEKLMRGDAYVYQRRGKTPIDGTYAVAGAVHLARTLPPPPPPLHVA